MLFAGINDGGGFPVWLFLAPWCCVVLFPLVLVATLALLFRRRHRDSPHGDHELNR